MNEYFTPREITTTALGMLIVITALYLLFATFSAAGSLDLIEVKQLLAAGKSGDVDTLAKLAEAVFSRKKDVLLYALSLLGVVVGYYFGRVPAEKRADEAEKKEQETRGRLNKVSDGLAHLSGMAEGFGAVSGGKTLGGDEAAELALQEFRQEIEKLRKLTE
jgi:hypothetical protein